MAGGKDILFEKFEIIECLKKDVGACVYIAHHIYLGKQILLKTMDRGKIADAVMLKRFQREAKTLARLNHENIIIVHDFGTFDSFFYISFEYFPGGNLRDVIEAKDKSLEQKRHIFAQILKGVAFAHKHKIIHRDLKPENILVNSRNQVKVADFGLALIEGEESLTAQTSIVGTPSYMSPEQIRGETLTPQSDLFSLGVIGYELFTGVNPFLGQDAGATLHNILASKNKLEQLAVIPQPEADLIAAMLNKTKSERLPSAGEALDRLASTEWNAPAPAHIDVEKRQKKTSWRFIAVGLVGAAIALFFILGKMERESRPGDLPAQTTADSNAVAGKEASLHVPTTTQADSSPAELVTEPAPLSQSQAVNKILPGRLLINCLPWAHVFIDSIKVDTTPMEEPVSLSAGEHMLRLEHPNFPAYVKKIRIKPGEEQLIAVDLDTLFGYFSCNIYPWGDIVIDDVYRGQTPFAGALAVEPGRHILVVKNQQYKSSVDSFFVARRDTFYYQFNFELAGERKSPIE